MPDAENQLLSFARRRDAEGDAAIVIGLFGRGQVEIREWNLLRVLWGEVPQSLPDDRIVADFLVVLVAEDQDRGGKDRVRGISLGMGYGAGLRVRILIAVGFLLAHHALLLQTLLVHLVGDGEILVVVVIVRRVVIPPVPQPGIIAPAPPRKTPVPAGEAEAVVGAEDETETVAVSAVAPVKAIPKPVVKPVMQEGAARETAARGVVETVGEAPVHSAGEVAATSVTAGEAAVTSSETTMTGEPAAMAAAETSVTTASAVTSAALRPQRHSQKQSERRDGNQAAHTGLL